MSRPLPAEIAEPHEELPDVRPPSDGDVAASTSFIDFGAFTTFTMVNLAVVAFRLRRREGAAPTTRLG